MEKRAFWLTMRDLWLIQAETVAEWLASDTDATERKFADLMRRAFLQMARTVEQKLGLDKDEGRRLRAVDLIHE